MRSLLTPGTAEGGSAVGSVELLEPAEGAGAELAPPAELAAAREEATGRRLQQNQLSPGC